MIILDTLTITLLSSLFICFVIQMIYWWVYMAKPYYKQRKGLARKEYDQPPLSVIVYIAYYDGNLEKNLRALLEQDYPCFEVIAINNNLPEEKVDILKKLRHEYSHFYFTHIPDGTRNLSRKKLGLSLGIKAAKYETLLFTESDSRPISKDWIKTLSSQFRSNKTIVLGFAVLNKQKGLRRRYAAFDYFFTNIQILCKGIEGIPYGANGRNMGYEKFHFVRQKGFQKYRFLQSGADDLFVNEIADNNNISVNVSLRGSVRTYWEDIYSWHFWKSERALTKRYYKKSSRLFWGFESFSRILFYALAICLVALYFSTIYIPLIALAVYLIRLASQLFIINKTASKLKSERYYFLLPLFDIFQLFVNAYYYFKSFLKKGKGYTWNLGQ